MKKILKIVSLLAFYFLIAQYIRGAITSIDPQIIFLHRLIIYIQLFVELFVFSQVIVIILGVFDIISDRSSDHDLITELKEYPEVDIFIPIRRVNEKIFEKTLIGVRDLNYPQDKINLFVADDTPEKVLSKKYKKITSKYNGEYIYYPENRQYKAGMLNLAIPHSHSKFIAFFDFDQIPQPDIMTHMIGLLELYPHKAFVQSKKNFRDLTNLSRIWSALLYLQFFEVYEKTKNITNSVMFAGSTACFRRSILDMIGDIPEETFTEDNYLSLKLLLNGYEGMFTNRIGSIGLVPNGYGAQISQLWRWSHGGTHTLSLNFKKILFNKKMNWGQKIEFISTLGITPMLVLVYLYTLSFVPLFIFGVDSPRIMLGPLSGIIFVPIAISLTYVIFAMLAIWFDRLNPHGEFEFKHLPGFLLIALSSNFLIFSSGLAGLLRVLGPNSRKGRWTREIPIIKMGLISLILGLVFLYFGVLWLSLGLSSALMLIVMSITLLPTILVVLIYRKPVKENF